MRILMIATYYYPRVGGGEDTIRNYCRIFKSKGHHVEIITKKYEDSLADEEYVDGIKVHRIPHSTKNKIGLINFWKWMVKNRRKLKNFDVVMLNDFSTFYWYLPLKILHKKPCVILYYGYEGFPIKKKNIILRKITKIFSTKSINGGKYLNKYYGFETDYYIGEGLEKMEKVSWEKKKNGAIFIGGLRNDTSILGYLETLKILKDKYKLNLCLDVYGGGELEKGARSYAEKNKLKVIFHGVVPGAKRFIPRYRYGFATQWGSIMDCMGSKTLIFSLCHLPITLDYDEEILAEGKYGVLSISPKEMAEKFYKYYKNKKLSQKLIEVAYAHSKTKSWDKVAEGILGVLSSVKRS
ncbi:MAG: glycosyltransferase family 4 protein [Nanoarchaeota archaeon]|nr:glycosyltransferase family 4 protein [Nanoarchaeota archaeon]